MEVGIALSGGLRPRELVNVARKCETVGASSFWVTEGAAGDAFALLAAVAGATSSIRLGTAVVSVYVRSLPLLAMGAVTLADLTGGRFTLGLGPSHREQVESEHGVPYERPLGRVRDAVKAVRQLAETGRIKDTTSRSLCFTARMAMPPVDLPVIIGATGPKMLQISEEIADGVILVWRTPEEAAEVAAAKPKGYKIACMLPCGVADSDEAAMSIITAAQEHHGRFVNYRRLFDRQESPGAVTATDVESLAAQLDAYRRAGVDEAVLLPLPGSGMDIHEAVDRLLVLLATAGLVGT